MRRSTVFDATSRLPAGPCGARGNPGIGSMRALLRWLALAAVVLAGLDLVLLVPRLWPSQPALPSAGGGHLLIAASLSLLAAVLLMIFGLTRVLARAEAASRLREHVLDALQAGIVLFDAAGRIVFSNQEFRRAYAGLGAAAQPGATYEQLLRAVVAYGMATEAAGDREDWITRRLADFGHTPQPLMRRMPDGSWRRIVEQRLPDGAVLAHITDVSDMVAKEEALEAARRDSEVARERLAGAIEALPATFELYDADDRLVLWNRRLADTYPHMAPHLGQRLKFEELTRLNLAAGGQPGYVQHAQQWIDLRLAQRRSGQQPSELMDNGAGRRLRMYETRLRDGSIVAIRVDVTDTESQRRTLDETRQELARSRQLLEDAIEAMPAGFELYDADDRLVMVNRMNLQMYPLLADLPAQRPTFEQVVRTNAARGGLPMLGTSDEIDAWIERRTRERRQPSVPFALHRTGEDRWIRTYERRMRDGSLVAIRLDVSELMQRETQLTGLNAQLAQLNDELSVLAQTDALTGLANRRVFDQRLAEEASRAARHGMPLALLLVDIDHFKAFNDRYGHPAGDDCLRRVAMRLRDCASRPTDLVARLGGEEFALLLPHADADTAFEVARRCVQAVDDAAIEHAASPLTGLVTISAGAATWVAGAAGGAALFAAADAALYSAKACGRHRAMRAAPD